MNQATGDRVGTARCYRACESERGDVQTAILAAAVFQAQGAKVSALELLPKWQHNPEPADMDADKGETQLRRHLATQAV